MPLSPPQCPTCGESTLLPEFPDANVCQGCALDHWVHGEDPFVANGYRGVGPAGAAQVTRGHDTVVFVASAAVRYYRGTAHMPPAVSTGSLALTAAAMTGFSAVSVAGEARTPHHMSSPDTDLAAHVAEVSSAESFIIDLRGMKDRPYNVCVGTGPAPSAKTYAALDAISSVCSRRGLELAVNEPFTALPPWTTTHYAQTHLGLPALQLQLSAALRNPVREPGFAQLTLNLLRAAAAAASSA